MQKHQRNYDLPA